VTPDVQLKWARHMLEHAAETTAGVWPRASALLARHALEQLLEDFWSTTAPSVAATRNIRAQLIALRGYAPVKDSASAELGRLRSQIKVTQRGGPLWWAVLMRGGCANQVES